MENYYAVERFDNYLAHYGVKGMHWGVRRANPDREKRLQQKAFYKNMKSLYKDVKKRYPKEERSRAFSEEASGLLPQDRVRKIAKLKRKEEEARLSGKSIKKDKAAEEQRQMLDDLLGKYKRKKVRGISAEREAHYIILNAVDDAAFGKDFIKYKKMLSKYSAQKNAR